MPETECVDTSRRNYIKYYCSGTRERSFRRRKSLHPWICREEDYNDCSLRLCEASRIHQSAILKAVVGHSFRECFI